MTTRATIVGPSFAERVIYRLVFRAETDPVARRIVIGAVNTFFKAVVLERKRGGHRLFDFARVAAIRFGKWRAPVLRELLKLDTDSLADMARLQDWEDRVFGVTGHWTLREKTQSTKRETHCPFAEAAKGEPALCSDVIHALETATFRELNPRYRLLPLETLLSKGGTRCEFRHVLDAD